MKLPASQALYAHWASLCHGRSAPDRDQLQPSALRHLLGQVFMLDVEISPAGEVRLPIRLSGTRLDALLGRDVRGTDFGDLWAVADRELVSGIARGVLDDASPAVLGGRAAPDHAPLVPFELLLLPLRQNGRTHARMLGGLALASTPSWLGLQAARPLEVTGWRALHERDAGRGLADPIDGPIRRGHLVVHEGGRCPDQPWPHARKAHVKPALSRSASHR